MFSSFDDSRGCCHALESVPRQEMYRSTGGQAVTVELLHNVSLDSGACGGRGPLPR